jgi:hypothetical protein
MEHHLRQLRRRLWDCRGTQKINGSCRIARETSFIKDCMAADDELVLHWVPEAPGFNSLRITDKNTLL